MNTDPDFFLTAAGEYMPLSEPRACWRMDQLRDSVRDDYLLVEIAPPLSGSEDGISKNPSRLILSTRHEGYSLFPVSIWPTYVYVACIVDDTIIETRFLRADQVELIAWGRIHATLKEAAEDYGKWKQAVSRTPSDPKGIKVPAICFFGEQDGPPEQLLKAKLIALFGPDERIWKAYLARADLGPESPSGIVLCLRTVMGADKKLVADIGNIFASIFLKHEHLDILFLSPEQESQLLCVCKPFYVRTVFRRTMG